MGGLSCGSECMRCLLFLFNFLLFMSGAALIALGLWFMLDPNVNDYLTVVQIDGENPHMRAAIYALIGVGAVVIFVGFLGCCGACRHSTCMLCWYAVLIVVVIVIQIAAIVLIVIYRNELGEELESYMIRSVQDDEVMDDKYGGEMSPLTASWHAMQVKLKCCGASNYRDYTGNSNFKAIGFNPVPRTCCVLEKGGDDPADPVPVSTARCIADALMPTTFSEDTDHLYVKGCYYAVTDWFGMHGYIMVAVACAIILLELLNVVFACCVRQELQHPVSY